MWRPPATWTANTARWYKRARAAAPFGSCGPCCCSGLIGNSSKGSGGIGEDELTPGFLLFRGLVRPGLPLWRLRGRLLAGKLRGRLLVGRLRRFSLALRYLGGLTAVGACAKAGGIVGVLLDRSVHLQDVGMIRFQLRGREYNGLVYQEQLYLFRDFKGNMGIWRQLGNKIIIAGVVQSCNYFPGMAFCLICAFMRTAIELLCFGRFRQFIHC